MKSCMVNNDNGMFWQIFALSGTRQTSFRFVILILYISIKKVDIKKSSTFCSVIFNDTWWYQADIVPVSRYLYCCGFATRALWEFNNNKIFGTIWKSSVWSISMKFQLKSEFKKSLSKFNNNLVFLSCILNKSVRKNV